MLSKPISKRGLVKLASREGEDEGDHILFRCVDAKAIQAKEEIHGLKGDTLVAVHKGMIARESKPVCSSDGGEVCLRIVKEPVSGTLEGGLEEASVP